MRSAKLNAFVQVGTDDTVTLYIHKAEMGQGTVTSLSMLLAEELECDWKKIRTEFPGVDPVAFGPMQGVFGSMSIRTSWEPLRKAGATAARDVGSGGRAKMECAEIAVPRRKQHGRQSQHERAAQLTAVWLKPHRNLPVPQYGVALKDPTQFKLVGKPQKRMDTPAKVSGKTTFGIDVKVPGMLYATLQRCPVFGGKVKSFDATKAKAVPGVKQVVQISNGVAVLADNTWAAMEGRKALVVAMGRRSTGQLQRARRIRQSIRRSCGEARRGRSQRRRRRGSLVERAKKDRSRLRSARIFRTRRWNR